MANRWTTGQLAAIETRDVDVLVSAAAGSGKTAVLVERIIRRITDKDRPVDVDRLVVVTFTKAAAGEMKHRIRRALDDRLKEAPHDERLIRQQTLINNAKITTIDSFCLDLIHNYFSNINIDPSFRTANDGEIKLLENDVMEQMLEELYREPFEGFIETVNAYGRGRNDEKLVEIILKIYSAARSYPWIDEWYDMCLNNYDDKKDILDIPSVSFYLKSIVKRITSLKGEAQELVSRYPGDKRMEYFNECLASHINMMQVLESFDSYEGFQEAVRNYIPMAMNKGSRNDPEVVGFKEVLKLYNERLKSYMEDAKAVLSVSRDSFMAELRESGAYVRTLIRLAREFNERMQQEKKRRNIIDFNDMEHMALDILTVREDGRVSYTAVADELSAFYEEILIDEYQDSNMLQEQILTAVSRTRLDGAHNNMYMVGDVKQSIYRFRMACPELFIGKYESFGDGSDGYRRIELQNNFRSRGSVLDSANAIFERCMIRDVGGIVYDDKARLNPGAEYAAAPELCEVDGRQCRAVSFAEDKRTEVALFDSAKLSDDKDMAEIAYIADKIKSLLNRGDGGCTVVWDNDRSAYRPIEYRDIVVLSRANAENERIVNGLLDMGIAAYTNNSKGLFSVYEIGLLIEWLSVIDNPVNDIAMAAVMLSYLGKLDTRQLAALRGIDKKSSLIDIVRMIYRATVENQEIKNVYDSDKAPDIVTRVQDENDDISERIAALDSELRERVVNLYTLIERYRRKSDVMSVYNLVWDALYNTGLYDYIGSMPAGERRQANLDIILRLAKDFESTSYSGLFNFLRYIQRMKDFDVELGEASVNGEHDNIVRVMTIHKSKGLEFPVVFVTGAGKSLSLKDATDNVIIHQNMGIGITLVDIARSTKKNTLLKKSYAYGITLDSVSEFLRVVYVALTRAREKLYITGNIQYYDKRMSEWEAIGHRLNASPVEEGYQYRGSCDFGYVSGANSIAKVVMPGVMADILDSESELFLLDTEAADRVSVLLKELKEAAESDGTDCENKVDSSDITESDNSEAAAYKLETLPPYIYDDDPDMKVKVSVSELKKQHMVEEFDYSQVTETDKEAPVPDFIKGDGVSFKANQRGTIYHAVMEKLDLVALSAEEDMGKAVRSQLKRLSASGALDASAVACVRVDDIVGFLMSDIGRRALAAAKDGCVYREQPFVFIPTGGKDQLVQGVIDMFIRQQDKLVLVDYKTDRNTSNSDEFEKVLADRYRVQLDYYAMALSQLTGLEVSERVIYSFALGKEIYV